MINDLINREALREDLRRFFPTEVLEGIEPKTLFAQIMHDIDNAPTVEEKPQGEWINEWQEIEGGRMYGACCSLCHINGHSGYRFCPNCGAYMQKGGAE